MSCRYQQTHNLFESAKFYFPETGRLYTENMKFFEKKGISALLKYK